MTPDVVSTGALSLSLLASVLSASLLGSVHCMGMCGPLVAVYSAAGGGNEGASRMPQSTLAHIFYHGGRAVTYTAVGALGGVFGSFVDWAGEAAGLARIAAYVSSGLLVLWGFGVLFPSLHIKSPFARLVSDRLVQLKSKPPVLRSSILGALTPLLPCGWFYAFALLAAGTGHATSGAIVMFVFWAGTVPGLLSMGAILSRLGTRLRRSVPVLTGALLILVGVLGVVSRMSHPLNLLDRSQVAAEQLSPHKVKCH